MTLDISFGKHRADTSWKVEYLEWDEFVDRLQKVRRTHETMAQYDKMTIPARGKAKDGPAFVGGFVRGGRRKKENVESRSLITLDADHGDDGFIFAAELVLGGTAYAIYSTHSYRPDRHKYRLIAPVDRTMSPDEYAAVSRKLAEQIGMDYFDKTTFEVHRLMYLRSCSKDAEPVLEVYQGDPLSVDLILAQYADWKDPLQWPRHAGDKAQRHTTKRMEDPRAKVGVVGAFCRCYTISEAIAEFLPDVYDPVDDSLTRYTHIGSTSYGGLVVYDEDTFAFSHHESDPCSGREVNAFDLVRLHKFGKLDDRASENTNISKLPSHLAMEQFAVQQPKVKLSRMAEIHDEFSSAEDDSSDNDPEDENWKKKLDLHPKSGKPLATAKNIELILKHGTWYGVLGYDAFGNTEIIRKSLPWRGPERSHRAYEPWLGADDKRLQHWFSKLYQISSAKAIQNAFTEVVHKNKFHPIKSYVESYSWDGVGRAERVFIDYLGAADNHYVKQVTRKMLLAAIKRLYAPGCKFDEMLVLIGPQGVGKSSLLAKLGREWFSDSLRTFENKEAGEHLQSGWIFEIGELSAMKKSEVEEVKAFLSKTEDRYRVAYDRQVTEFPRKCVFFGTTNTKDFLRDTTGNRRFWPVEVHPEKAIYNHWNHLTEYLVGQIWAEVLSWFKAGESLALDEDSRVEAGRQQAAHLEADPREGIIQEWLETPIKDEWGEENEVGMMRNRVCASQIWTECLNNKKGAIRSWEAREICDIMRRVSGWRELKNRVQIPGYGKQTAFERADSKRGQY